MHVDTTQLSTATTADRVAIAGFGLTEGALEGALNRLTNVLGSTVAFTIDPRFRDETIEKITQNQALVDAMNYLADFAVYLPKADSKELVDLASSRLANAYAAFKDTVTGGIPHPHLPGEDEIKHQLETYLRHLAGAWGRGDPNELIDAVRPVGNVVGETATDVLVGEASFAALAELARAPRYVNAAIASWKDERTIAKMKANFPSAAQQTLELKAQELSKSKYPLLEEAFDAQRPLQDVELGVGLQDDGAGLADQTITAARKWTSENPNKTIVVIPNEANVAALRDGKLAVGKIENIKPKSMATIEHDLFGGRADDINCVILRGDLNSLSKSDVNQIVDSGDRPRRGHRGGSCCSAADREEAAEGVGAASRTAVRSRRSTANGCPTSTRRPARSSRTTSVSATSSRMTRPGKIPNQFRGVDNGLDVEGPQQYPGFKIQYYDKEFKRLPADQAGHAKYAVPTQESPTTGKLVKITGDDDGIFIGQLNGLGLESAEINGAYHSLMDVFNHPFSDTWLAKINKKLEIFSRYFETIPGTQSRVLRWSCSAMARHMRSRSTRG